MRDECLRIPHPSSLIPQKMSRGKRFSSMMRGSIGGMRRVAGYATNKVRARRVRKREERSRELTRVNGARRVVITGIGAITCLGLSLQETWDAMVAGKSGIGPVTRFDASHLPVRIAGEIKGFDASKYIDQKELRRTARVSHVAVAAAQEAYLASGLEIGKDVQHDRVGVVMGTAMGGFEMSESALADLRIGPRKMNPFALPAALPNAPGHHISKVFGAKGVLSTVVAACASGTQSIGDAAEMIRRGKADAMFAGGVEAVINESALAGFALMRVLSTNNENPEGAQRPFDITRNGFVYSEGCVVMMLESLEVARGRGAHIYAEVLGLGVSSDAYHIAIPDPTGSGAVRAMQWAIEDAGVRPEDVDYVNAHGSATETNDPLETKAIKLVFGERAYDIPVSSTKSMTGHAMGASGSIEALATVMSLKTGILTPTINLNTPDPECDLDYVPNVARKDDIQVAVSNSFGLGGQNASIVLARYEE